MSRHISIHKRPHLKKYNGTGQHLTGTFFVHVYNDNSHQYQEFFNPGLMKQRVYRKQTTNNTGMDYLEGFNFDGEKS